MCPIDDYRPEAKHFYNMLLRRHWNTFIVSASSGAAALEAVNIEFQRLRLPAVVPSDCVISRAIVLQGA